MQWRVHKEGNWYLLSFYVSLNIHAYIIHRMIYVIYNYQSYNKCVSSYAIIWKTTEETRKEQRTTEKVKTNTEKKYMYLVIWKI